MSVEFAVISIGALSRNLLWGETAPVRTSHATTTLVVEGERRILVDPSLPSVALDARFFERTGKRLDTITDVFCTTLRPVHRRSIEAFPKARWWASEVEIESHGEALKEMLDSAQRLEDDDVARLQADIKLLHRFKPAPDSFGPQVSLYPLAGCSAGSTGLLLTPATMTVIVAGDAALTAEHVARVQIWEGAVDTDSALKSLQDLLEMADVIVPGHDNVMVSPQRFI